MTNHPGSSNYTPPLAAELQALFEALPDQDLLTKLRGPKRRGRKGYEPRILWRCFVALYYVGLPSISDLVRLLHDNPFVARSCGIESPDRIPSQPTFSRFGTKLSKLPCRLLVKDILRSLTRHFYETLPDFGKSVAIDSTDIKAWSNGAKRGAKKKVGKRRLRQEPHPGRVSDPDAGWAVKANTEGNKKYVWGYKVHILADTKYELPIAIDVSSGNVNDTRRAEPLLAEARHTYGAFHPQYVICDAGYSSEKLRHAIKRQYRAEPVIDPNPTHKKAMKVKRTLDWKLIYNRRTAIERLNGRLKQHRRLNLVRVRGRFKLRVHVMLAVLVLQAQAAATGCRAMVRKAA